MKPAQVGNGVVVAVVTTGVGVVVTVLMRTVQHVAESHLPIWHTVPAAITEWPSGHV